MDRNRSASMADVSTPTKFVCLANSHLICSICNNIYNEPVINVKCGHTFCKDCLLRQSLDNNTTKCPVDDATCDMGLLVVNKAVESQIDDLEIYCRHGLEWSEDMNDYSRSNDGCKEVIKYGARKEHEDVCEHAFIFCPNDEIHCSRFKKKDISTHLLKCLRYSCPYKNSGCVLIGSQVQIATHCGVCSFKHLSPSGAADATQIMELKAANKALHSQVKTLSSRLDAVEKAKANTDYQLETCLKMLQALQEKQRELQERVEKQQSSKFLYSELRRKPSASGAMFVGELKRTPSRVSLQSTLSSPRVESWNMPFQFQCIGTLRGHREPVWCLMTHENWLFSGGDDKVIKVWDLGGLSQGCLHTITGHTDKVQTLAVGENYLYSGGADLSICVWSLQDHSLVKRVEKAHEDIVAAMVCSSDYLFTSSHQVIKVWDANSLSNIHTMGGLHHWVRSLAFGQKKEDLYSGCHNAIDIWDCSGNFNPKKRISHTYGSAYSLAITERYIIAGTYNQNVVLFSVDTHQFIKKLTGHVSTVMSVITSVSGRFLFTASSDATVQLWNLENLLPIQSLQRHEGSVNSLVLHNDLMLSGSEDADIKVFKYIKLLQPGSQP